MHINSNLIHIENKNLPSEISTENDLEEVLIAIAYECRRVLSLKNKNGVFLFNYMDTSLICNSICGILGIKNVIFPIESDNFNYSFVVISARTDNKNVKYIFDPYFFKFFENDDNDLSPRFFISRGNEKQKIIRSLVEDGFFKINENNLKLYCDSIILTICNKSKNISRFCYISGISGKEYVKSINEEKIFYDVACNIK